MKWPVQSPKPNGAGMALKKTSSSPKSPAARRELVEVEPPVLGVHHALRQAGGARGGVEQEERVGVGGGEAVGGRRVELAPSGIPASSDGAVDVDQHDAVDAGPEPARSATSCGCGAAPVLGDGDAASGHR